MSDTPKTKPANRILAALPPKEYRRLLPDFEPFDLNFTQIIYEPDDVIGEVYFPESGIVSLLSAVGEQSTLEVGIVGKEGVIGLPVFLGVAKSRNRAVVQGTGVALKIKTAVLLRECETGGGILPRLLRRYAHSLLTQISQSAVCNRFHQIDARLARWLLMTRDRMGKGEFQLTQEFLSNMLGVRREAVTIAASNFQQRKLISYSRGNIKILDQTGLEEITCQCYVIIKDEEEGFLSVK